MGSGCDTLRARAIAQEGVEKYRDGNIKKAAELFEQAAQIDPSVPPIQLNRGFTNLSLYQLSPKSKEGTQAANSAIAAFKLYMTLPVKEEQKSRARDYLLQTFSDAQKYEEAEQFFKPQLEKTPPDVEALIILGNIAKGLGKTDEARKWLLQRIQANPKDTDGYLALANMDFEELCADSSCRSSDPQKPPPSMPPEKRLEKANHGIDLLKKAIALAPNNATYPIFANLLLIQRSYAYVLAPPPPPDPKVKKKANLADLMAAREKAQKEVDDKKRADLDEAKTYRDKAVALMKAAGMTKDTKAAVGSTGKDGATKDAGNKGAAPAPGNSPKSEKK